MTLSIRARLLFWMTGGMAILLLVFAVGVYGVLTRSLMDSFDKVLLASARTISGATERYGALIRFDLDEHEAPEFYRSIEPDYFQLWLENGEPLAGSPALKTANMQRFPDKADSPSFRMVQLPDGRAGRAVGLAFTPKADDETEDTAPAQRVTLVVARGTDTLDATIGLVRWLLALAACGTLILALFLGAVAVRRGLKPLDALAGRIAAIRQEDLSARIPVDRMPAEMAPVVGKLNDLLCRLDKAFLRERAFASDAAHELRTPLAGLRCTMEVALSQPRHEDEYREAIADCLDVIRHTQRIVETLLALSRLESGQTALHPETIEVGDLIDTTWRPLADKAARRGIRFRTQLPPNSALRADRNTCQMILAALLANAAEYTDTDGRIDIHGRNAAGTLEITIANTGCPLAGREAQHVFDRFWRGDPSRSATGTHCGLGLSLVQRAVAALGGTVSIDIDAGTFTVRLVLPAAPGPGA